MEVRNFCSPILYSVGIGAENYVGRQILQAGGRRVLIVCGEHSARESGLIDRITQALSCCSLFYILHEGLSAKTDAAEVRELIADVRDHSLDFILAVGGGSVIDAVKAASIGALHEGDFFELFFAGRQQPIRVLPWGAVQTVPGSGAESSRWCFITSGSGMQRRRLALHSKLILPRFALYNPELCVSLPAYQSACGIAEIFTHAAARYFAAGAAQTIGDRMSEGVMLSLVELGQRLSVSPENYELRADLLSAAVLAQFDFSAGGRQTDLAAVWLADQISVLYGKPYGAALAVVLPALLECFLPHAQMRLAQFAVRIFGLSLDYEDPARTARSGIAALRHFFQQLGLPLTFSELGLPADALTQLLVRCSLQRELPSHYSQLTRTEAEAVYRAAAHFK